MLSDDALSNVTNILTNLTGNESSVDDCGTSLNGSAKDCSDSAVTVWGKLGGGTSLIAFVILLVEGLTFYGTVKMSRIPFATRFLFCLNLLLDCCFIFILVIATPLRQLIGESHMTKTIEIGTEIGRLTMAGSWVCMVMLSVERLFCIAYPHEYMRFVSKRRLVLISISSLATVWTVKLLTRYLIIPYVYGLQGFYSDADILTWILGICIIICLICNVYIVKIVNRHKRQVQQQASSIGVTGKDAPPPRSCKSTNAVWVLIIVFIVLYLPWFFIKVMRSFAKTDILRSTEFVFMIINCCTNPIVYAWRLKECRYHILALFGRCSNSISARAERMRINVFSINIREPSTGSTMVNVL